MGKIKKPSWVGTVILSGFISSLPQLAWEKKAMLLLLLWVGTVIQEKNKN